MNVGILYQFKIAPEMMKNMTPEQIQQLMKQAEDGKKMLEETVRKVVDEEIGRRDLASRKELAGPGGKE